MHEFVGSVLAAKADKVLQYFRYERVHLILCLVCLKSAAACPGP
jgi:hypothetical protein